MHISLRLVIVNNTYGILDSPDPFIPKLPYDKAAMPVKRIEAVRIGDPGLGGALFGPTQTHAPLPEVIASKTTGGRH